MFVEKEVQETLLLGPASSIVPSPEHLSRRPPPTGKEVYNISSISFFFRENSAVLPVWTFF